MEQHNRGAARIATLIAVPAALLAGVLIFGLLGGFGRAAGGTAGSSSRPQATTPVSMPAPGLPGRAAMVCRALLATAPPALRDLSRRPVTAGTGQNAAYGDPPITVACGTPPAAYAADSFLFGLSGTCWHVEERADATVWTTVDREVPVRVTVPVRYEGPGDWVAGLADAVGSLPVAANPPSCDPRATD